MKNTKTLEYSVEVCRMLGVLKEKLDYDKFSIVEDTYHNLLKELAKLEEVDWLEIYEEAYKYVEKEREVYIIFEDKEILQ